MSKADVPLPRVPLVIVTGPLGSGKTTLLRHILEVFPQRMAIIMNEFGEVAIDSKIIEGKNVRMAELGGGCVCCSLLGEFEAAVEEILATVEPDYIVVETTGVAEPDALIFDIEEGIPTVRLDGVITVMDADSMLQFPQLGHTTRMQLEAADTLLLNKKDLVSEDECGRVEEKLRQLNNTAQILSTRRCRVDPDLLFGMTRRRQAFRPHAFHQPEFESFVYRTDQPLERECFEDLLQDLGPQIFRAKGFVRLGTDSYLFNFVAGRWDLEPFTQDTSVLVFIGKEAKKHQPEILARIEHCER